MQAFQKTVADYVKVHNEAESKIPALSETRDPAKISAREAALGVAITALRAGARPGDIFVPEVQPVFVEAVRRDFSTRTAVDRKAMVEELPKQIDADRQHGLPDHAAARDVPGEAAALAARPSRLNSNTASSDAT